MESKQGPQRDAQWKQLNAIVYQPIDLNGETLDRFQLCVENTNGLLAPGEAEEIAASIIRDHEERERLVTAVRQMRQRHKHGAQRVGHEDCGCEDCNSLEAALKGS